MAIAPPSDIVMDVVNAADPTRIQEAQERLQTASATLAATRLTQQGQGFETNVASLDKTIGVSSDHAATKSAASNDHKTPESYRKFEAMVLQNFIQYMMPDDNSDVYGQGIAGGYWKSMMAEQIANSVAKHGGVGIADHMMRGTTYDKARKAEHTADQAYINNVASTIVDQQQRAGMSGLLPTVDDKKDKDARVA